MTPLVRGDDVQPRGQAEPDSTNEWIRETDSGQIDAGVRAQERPHLILRCQECRHRIVECWRRPGPDRARRFRLEVRSHGWFEIPYEPRADETRLCGPAPLAAIAECPSGGWLHRFEVYAIRRAQMIETFCDAPRAGIRAPGTAGRTQAVNESARVAFSRVERLFQSLQVCRKCAAPLPYVSRTW